MLADLSRMIPTSSPAVHEGAVEIKRNGVLNERMNELYQVSEYSA